LQTDGKIVAGGSSASDFILARYFGGNDDEAPRVSTPTQTLQSATALGTSTVPVRISWSATDAQGDVTRYELQRSTDGGAYAKVALATPTTATLSQSLSPNHNYRYRVRATDDNGNTSFFEYGPRFTVDAHQETSTSIAYTGLWRQQLLGGSYGGQVKFATAAGSTAKLTFTGQSVAWVAPKGSTRGKADVLLDGRKVATVDLSSSRTLPRRVVYAANGLSPSVTHTLQVKVLGTAGRPRVDVDAFVVLR
jgi:Fibronectin type III domain